MPARIYRRIFLTGASMGIGRALAEAYAELGVTLGLVARNAGKLEELRLRLEQQGCRAIPFAADVRDAAQMREAAQAFCAQAGGVDLVIANAGISHPDRLLTGDPAQSADIVQTNVQGVLYTLLPFVPPMVSQGGGHLVTIGSVAGFRGLPGKGAYCASKAAVKTLTDAYRPVLRRHGIRVTNIQPGFIATELTAKNKHPMPFLMSADKAARLIQRAIARGAANYVLPWQMRLVIPLLVRLPDVFLPTSDRRA